ncbi:MAG: cytochrome P450 [Proteobacteria bacterium]|jgi:cytochrome P450|nr:cytochrome P450 [Pseudomonadota bacterium]
MFSFDPYSREVDVDPYPLYKILRDQYPCYWSEPGDCWVLTRHNDIVEAVMNWEVFSSGKGNMLDDLPERAGSTLGTTDPPRHDRLRVLVQAAFMKRSLDYLIQPIKDLANEAIDKFIDRGEFEFITEFSSPVTVGVLSHLLGMPRKDQLEIRRNIVLTLTTDPETRQKTAANLAGFEWLKKYTLNLLDEHKRSPKEDLLTRLIEAEVEGDKLRDQEIHMTSLTLIMAGVESASSFMTMLALNLDDHAQQKAAVIKEPELINNAIEESLRFNTTAQRFRRTLTVDHELHGQAMRAGDKVIMCYGAAGRDERQHSNPDTYDIHRKPEKHLGLGAGKHFCLGNLVAKLMVEHAMTVFYERMPEVKRKKEELEWITSTTFRSPVSTHYEI